MLQAQDMILGELRRLHPTRTINFVMEVDKIDFSPYLMLVVDGKKTLFGYNPQLITDAYQHAGDFVRRVQDKIILL